LGEGGRGPFAIDFPLAVRAPPALMYEFASRCICDGRLFYAANSLTGRGDEGRRIPDKSRYPDRTI